MNISVTLHIQYLFPFKEARPSHTPPAVKLQVKVICGQHLPKSEQKLKGDVIEPYVKVRLRGHPDDDNEYVTKVVPKVSEEVFTKTAFIVRSNVDR